MITFKGEPHLTVRLNPPLGLTKHVKFDENGTFNTNNERLIKRMQRHFKAEKVYLCKKCDFTAPNIGKLGAHYRKEHPKEG